MTLTVAFLVLAAPPAASQAARSPRQELPHVHVPAVAGTLGFLVPGAGHVYSHEYAPGLAFLVGTITTYALGQEVRQWDSCMFEIVIFFPSEPCVPDPEPYRTAGTALMILAGVGWIASAIDAPRAAHRANAEHKRTAVIISGVTPRRLQVGVRIPL